MVRNIRLKVFLMKTVFTAAGALSRLIRKDSRKVLIYANEGFRDNSRYLFDYMLRNGYQRKYRIIVASDDYKELLASPVPGVKYESCLRGVADYLSAGCVYYSFGKIPTEYIGRSAVIDTVMDALTSEQIQSILDGTKLTIDVEGKSVELDEEKVIVERFEKDDLKVLNDGTLTVGLDSKITDELKKEGYVLL